MVSDRKLPFSKSGWSRNRRKPEVTGIKPAKSTEDQVNMRDIVPQRLDRHGTRIEDIAGTGAHDSLGG